MTDVTRETRRNSRRQREAQKRTALVVKDLNVFYGQSHCLQNVSLDLPSGTLAVVGRNGMGKTTLCNAIMGLTAARGGSIRFQGREICGRTPDEICNLGIGYVPQGRRVWPSLSVDEHLRLAFRGGEEAIWSVERVYQTFPRLAERRNNGGGQLSGGEQQMLAIARALLVNPTLLVMDEPTEGLAPVIVQQVESMLHELTEEDGLSVLLIEQNIGVATEVSENVAIMVNGAIHQIMPARELAGDVRLQQQLLGVGRQEDAQSTRPGEATRASADTGAADRAVRIYAMPGPLQTNDGNRAPAAIPNRWGASLESVSLLRQKESGLQPVDTETRATASASPLKPILGSVQNQMGRTVLVAGTFDTKARELGLIRDEIAGAGLKVLTVDLSTSSHTSRCDVTPKQVASNHPRGSAGVFSSDRGASITAMRDAFVQWIADQRDIGGIISAGGSGGTALVTPAMRALPVGLPKIMISTVASGDVGQYVGPSDIMMMHSVADVQGLNTISRQILRNGAHAMVGAVRALPDAAQRERDHAASRPSIGITMFGVTTPAVQALTERLGDHFDCLVFHCTGIGGLAMEKLADSGALSAVIDLTTTEIADHLVGGVFSAGEERMDAIIRSRIPYVGSCGALDMVNFGAKDTVPERFQNRKLHVHNPQVTLMRTTADENRRFGEFIADKLNLMEGPVRFLIPEGGVSLLDQPGQPFHDPAADTALFDAIESRLRQTANRKLVRVAANVNEPEFVDRVIDAFHSIHQPLQRRRA